ncbi:glycosyltransferase family 4 protein [Pontibacillus litoralis]|uniref:Glycosyl transferase n=1 Tax=Pontibacillus litoralis JSM 072002 TaxID=1385512 RepID=A0A0A5FZ64_9BACI|nr:glycosyltransferase family 1 protein [Pontibacillus litoralis]KGX86131.1 glycosyl transferase [Pontibacillus litoralis JSM 072002]
MKIAIFTDTFTPQVNGVARTFQRFVDYLNQQGIEYRLFVPDAKDEDLFSNQIHRFTSIPFYLYPECRFSFPKMHHIRKQLESFRPDLIHIATPFNIGLSGLYYGKKLNIPIVGSYHTHFDRYLQYYDLQFLSKWIWKYMRWFHQSFRSTFVPSQETKQQLLQQGFHNIGIWSRGVDCQLFQPLYNTDEVRRQYNIKAPHILSYVGRLAPEKDLHTLMATAKQLPSHIQQQVHWIIVGDGPMATELKEKAPSNMSFTGYLKGERLAEIYSASTLFVFPSTTETFGNVVLESLACGTPAIGAKAGGVQEVITHQTNGLLCEPNNEMHFAQAITRLISNDIERKRMSDDAREAALQRSWAAIFEDLLYQYERAIHMQEQSVAL